MSSTRVTTPQMKLGGTRPRGLLERWDLKEPLGYPEGANRYTFVESDPVALVDPTGLDAWKHTNNWNDKRDGKTFRQLYEEWVVKNASRYGDDKRWERKLCSAVAAEMLVDFAEENGLPVTFQNQQGQDVSSWSFESKEKYVDALVGGGTNALISPDTLGNVGKTSKEWINDGDPRAPKNVTPPLNENEVRPGDIVNGAAYGRGQPNHTIVITNVVVNGNDIRMDTCENDGHKTNRTVKEILTSIPGWQPRFRRWHDNVFKPKPKDPPQAPGK